MIISPITSLFALQLFVVDQVDIGLLNVVVATGRRRLNETITLLADVIEQGLTGTVDNFRYGVTSLRQCASGDRIDYGCGNGEVVAKWQPELTDTATFINKIEAGNRLQHWLLAIAAFNIINL